MVNYDNVISDQDSTGDELKNRQGIGKDQDFCFEELYEQSLQNVQFGEIVTGKIVQFTNDVAMVDVGWKTEGYIPLRELKDENGAIAFPVGEELEVFIDRKDEDGNLVLSRDKAAKIRVWEDIRVACERNEPIRGTMVEHDLLGCNILFS